MSQRSTIQAQQGGEVDVKDMLFGGVHRLTIADRNGVAGVYLTAEECRQVCHALLVTRAPIDEYGVVVMLQRRVWEYIVEAYPDASPEVTIRDVLAEMVDADREDRER